jgi:pSer/pThr/pTyr-binding forkhead associated (FHA) protein
MQVKLRLLGGSHAGQEIAVPGPRFRIGRGAKCQLRPKSDAVADEHCELQIEPGEASVLDLGSPQGTFVNGKRVAGASILKAGDRLKVGPLEFEVEVIVRVSGAKKPKVNSVEEAAERMAGGARDDLDIESLLAGDDTGTSPSRYATQLSADELAALGMGGGARPADAARSPAAPSSDNTGDKAADALNKMYKRR